MENTIVCAHCNSENSTKNLFCQNCGKPLTTAKPAVPGQAGLPTAPVSPPVIPVSHSTPPQFTPVITPPPTVNPPAPEAVIPEPKPIPEPQAFPTVFPVTQKASSDGQVPPPMPTQKPIQLPLPTIKPAGNRIHELGTEVVSWMDLIGDGAEKGPVIADQFDRQIESRNIPGLTLSRKELFDDGIVTGRTYHLLENENGVKVAVFFGSQGKDLRLGWTLYTKPTINLIYLAGLLGATALLTLVITLIAGGAGFGFIPFLFGWFNRFYNWLFPVIVVAALVGFLWKGDWLFFFFKRANRFAMDEGKGLTMAAHQAIVKSVESAGFATGVLREYPTETRFGR